MENHTRKDSNRCPEVGCGSSYDDPGPWHLAGCPRYRTATQYSTMHMRPGEYVHGDPPEYRYDEVLPRTSARLAQADRQRWRDYVVPVLAILPLAAGISLFVAATFLRDWRLGLILIGAPAAILAAIWGSERIADMRRRA